MSTEIRRLLEKWRQSHSMKVWACADELEALLASQRPPTEDVGKLRWTLDNIYTVARREASREDPRARWGHVLRLCEAIGCQGRGVLRASEPTVPSPADPPSTQRRITLVYGEQGWVVVPNPQAGMPKDEA
jgi:hypothetical protein